MAITIDGVTYRNLQEQVGKNAEDISALQDTQKKIISGDQPLTKQTVSGTLDVEGKLTAGGDAEVDGKLSLNSPESLNFKTGALATPIVKRYIHVIRVSFYRVDDTTSTGRACWITFLLPSSISTPFENPDDIIDYDGTFLASGTTYVSNTPDYPKYVSYVQGDGRNDYVVHGTSTANTRSSFELTSLQASDVSDYVIDLCS